MNDYVLYIGVVKIILVVLFWREYHVLLFVWCCFNLNTIFLWVNIK